jgi:hypothetical protein
MPQADADLAALGKEARSSEAFDLGGDNVGPPLVGISFATSPPAEGSSADAMLCEALN